MPFALPALLVDCLSSLASGSVSLSVGRRRLAAAFCFGPGRCSLGSAGLPSGRFRRSTTFEYAPAQVMLPRCETGSQCRPPLIGKALLVSSVFAASNRL